MNRKISVLCSKKKCGTNLVFFEVLPNTWSVFCDQVILVVYGEINYSYRWSCDNLWRVMYIIFYYPWISIVRPFHTHYEDSVTLTLEVNKCYMQLGMKTSTSDSLKLDSSVLSFIFYPTSVPFQIVLSTCWCLVYDSRKC